MQAIEWKRKSFGSVSTDAIVADLSAVFTPRCPACRNLLAEQPIEIIADFGDWHLGWRKYSCTHCGGIGSRLVLSRHTRHLQYQTHSVC